MVNGGMTGRFRAACAMAYLMLAAAGAGAQADDYPSHPITFVSPYAAGGSGDGVCRLISSMLAKKIGQTIVHESRPGANIEIALTSVAKAKPDGYTVLCAPSPMLVNPHIFKDTKYDPFRDFDPIGLAMTYNYVLYVSQDVPARTMAEFVALAKAQPGKLTYGSSGVGNGSHLAFEMLSNVAKIDVLRVPYKASSQVLVDLLAGRISAAFDAASSMDAITGTGKARALASERPIPSRPDLPRISDAVPGFSLNAWFGLAAPKGMPADRVALLSKGLNEVLRDPAYVSHLTQGAMVPAQPSTPAEFGKFMRTEFERYGKLVRENDIQPER